MDEHEEGEITDSEGENDTTTNSFSKVSEVNSRSTTSTATNSSLCSNPTLSVQTKNTNSYRLGVSHNSSDDSDSSNFSDEDTDLWRCKKRKYFSSSKREQSMMTDLPEHIKSPPRSKGPAKLLESAATVKRKINNIWGSVLNEQSLTQNMKDVGVYKNPELKYSDRNVEKYDFTNAYDDDRPEMISIVPIHSNDPFENVINSDHEDSSLYPRGSKRKRKVIDGLGKKRDDHHRKSSLQIARPSSEFADIGVTEESNESDITNAIASELFESKTELIGKIVHVIGKRKALQTLQQVLEIEETGGMLTVDGMRRRSPGGAYFTLIKKDESLTKRQQNEIFAEEDKKFMEERKKIKREQRQRKKQKRRLYSKLPQYKLLNANSNHENGHSHKTNFQTEVAENSGSSEDEIEHRFDATNIEKDSTIVTSDMITDDIGGDIIDIAVGEEESIY